MKKIAIILFFITGFLTVSNAQRYAYVDTKYILDNMPEYQAAQKELDDLSMKWQQEIEDKFSQVEKARNEFEAEAILLPEEIKKTRQEEIEKMNTNAKDLQKRYFGVNGELFTQREVLIKPIQDRIFKAIQDIAKVKNYAFIFDKANQSNLLFADPKFDISNDVLREMGITVTKK